VLHDVEVAQVVDELAHIVSFIRAEREAARELGLLAFER
jgi:hypothetical protein